ncbi:hypothetical protein [Turicimonas muris]|nr:hypothetical protein [Turicimonas muris]
MQLKFLAVLVSSAVCSSLALAAVPNVSEATKASAEAINSDPVMQKIKKELETPEAQKWRFNTHMEVVRIASPSRSELRRQEELMRRFVQEWGIDEKNVMSRVGGNLPGAGLQKVDGLPVYNACVRIPGTYSQTAGAQTYAGQGPKVLLEGHIDTVNPPVLPPKDKP